MLKFWLHTSWLTPVVILIFAIGYVATKSPFLNALGIVMSMAAIVSWIGLAVTAVIHVARGLRRDGLVKRHRIARDYARNDDGR